MRRLPSGKRRMTQKKKKNTRRMGDWMVYDSWEASWRSNLRSVTTRSFRGLA